jgi:hypothetical protein
MRLSRSHSVAAATLVLGCTLSASAEAYTSRSLIDTGVQSFKTVNPCYVDVLGTDQNLWHEDYCAGQGTYNRSQIDAAVIDFQPINSIPQIYVLGSNRNLWNETKNGGNRFGVDAAVKSFQGLDSTWVFVQGTDDKLWIEDRTANSRTLVDPSVLQFQAAGSSIYALHTDRTLWRETDPTGPWMASGVDGAVAAFAAVDDTTVYVLGTDGKLWNETGNANHRFLVDTNVQAFVPLNAQDVYVLGTDANLWREVGTYKNRAYVDNYVFIDSANPHVPYFTYERGGTSTQTNPNVLVMGSDRHLWLESMDSGGQSMNPPSPPPTGMGTVNTPPPPPACFECYANCGNGCIDEGAFCSLNAAGMNAPGCGICCGTASMCAKDSTCI